jgi:DNA-directed RNA polymerase specialized sigma24 family protein
MLNPSPAPLQREDIFVERYDRLLAWTLQMTERDHELAEDLLHDLFIQFILNEPDLQKIGNLDGYLYTMLRNLHLAQRRRDTRNTLQQLSIVE